MLIGGKSSLSFGFWRCHITTAFGDTTSVGRGGWGEYLSSYTVCADMSRTAGLAPRARARLSLCSCHVMSVCKNPAHSCRRYKEMVRVYRDAFEVRREECLALRSSVLWVSSQLCVSKKPSSRQSPSPMLWLFFWVSRTPLS